MFFKPIVPKFNIDNHLNLFWKENEDNKISNNWYYLYVQMHEYIRF